MKKDAASTSRMGRPRQFEADDTLNTIMRVFWRKGYHGTSLSDLTEATGVSRPSLYSAFGNKEAVFRKALDRYVREKLDFIDRACAAPTGRGVAEALLRGMLALQTDPREPKGCLCLVHSVGRGVEPESVRTDIMAHRQAIKNALVTRFERSRTDGDLSPSAGSLAITIFLVALLQGMALQGAAGATRHELESLIVIALAQWPEDDAQTAD